MSSYDADELESRVVIAHVSGVSGAIVRVSDRLEATVQGPSRLVYIGDPEVINNGDPEPAQISGYLAARWYVPAPPIE